MNFAIFLPIFRSLFRATMITTDKYLLSIKNSDKFFMGYLSRLVTVILLIIPVYFLNQYHYLLNAKFIMYTMANVSGNVFLTILTYYILKKFDASYVITLKSTQPFIFAIISFFILGEVISFIAIIGIVFVAIGAVFLEKSRLKDNQSFSIIQSGWPLILLEIVIAGIITNFSKMAVLEADALIYLWTRCFIMFVIFYIVYSFQFSRKGILKKKIEKVQPKHAALVAISGVLLLGSTICEMYALKYLPIAKVEALTKLDLIILLILEYFFITKVINIKRIISAALIFIGILFLILG